MNKLLTIVLVLGAYLSTLSDPNFGQSSKAKEIDDYIAPFAKANQFSGVVLAAENGKVIYEKAFGMANADFRIPNQTNTRFGIASLTKSMTLVVLASQIDRGKISLNDKLSKYIPDFPNGDKITIEMLADHRSGILHRVMKPEEEALSYTSAEFIEKVKQTKPAFEPGTQRLYSSAGYAVLARAMEIASGKSYPQLLEEYVFTPAGMKNSLNFESERIIESRAQDYLPGPAGYINAPLKDYSFLVGAGSVYSTAGDIYKFAEAVLDGKYGETVKPFLVGKTDFWGNGSTNGHRAYFKIEREKKWGYTFVSNLNSGANDLIQASIEAILLGKEVSRPVVPNPNIILNPDKNLAEFTGQYRRQSGDGGIEITVKNNMLFSGDIKFYPIKTDCFFEYRFYGDVCFVRDETGRIKQVEWVSPGVKSIWVKQ